MNQDHFDASAIHPREELDLGYRFNDFQVSKVYRMFSSNPEFEKVQTTSDLDRVYNSGRALWVRFLFPPMNIPVAVLVDRAPADGVVDFAAIVSAQAEVKVKTQATGEWTEQGKGGAPARRGE